MSEEDRLLRAACKIEGCKPKDLLSHRVTSTHVIMIVGPVGFKKIVAVEDLGVGPVSFENTVEASEPPATFEGLVSPRIWGILVEAKLTDPEALQGKTNTDLEGVEGLGRASVREIREALDQLG
jgi:hypothetical protein